MKRLAVAYRDDRIGFQICLVASERALRRHWLAIDGDRDMNVTAFTSCVYEKGWWWARAYFPRKACAALLAHEGTHVADFLWDSVRKRRVARGVSSEEFRAYMVGTFCQSYHMWDKKSNAIWDGEGLWEGI